MNIMKNGPGSEVHRSGPSESLQEPKSTKRPSVFSKRIKKLSKSTSILNFGQVVYPNSPTPATSSSSFDPGSNTEFQAIGYDSTTTDPKEPIHVMYLPERTSKSTLSPRQLSTGSRGSHETKISEHSDLESFANTNSNFANPNTNFANTNNNFANTNSNFANPNTNLANNNSIFLSLDPKSQSQPGLAEVGLNLVGYGLSHEDLQPPPSMTASNLLPSIGYNLNQRNGSTSSLVGENIPKPSKPNSKSQTLYNINTRLKTGTRNISPSLISSKSSGNHAVQSFAAVATYRNQMPIPEIVDQLFEKLLSTRAFSGMAVKTLKEQPYQRKWELLLRESETNSGFDLKTLTKQATAFISQKNDVSPTSTVDPRPQPERKQSTSDIQADFEESDSQHSKQHAAMKVISRIGGGTKKFTTEDNYYKPHRKSFESNGSSEDHQGSLLPKKKLKDGTPEWFVARIMSNKLTVREFKKLEKRLSDNSQKYGVSWVSNFIEAQGETALSVILSRVNKKSIKSNEEFDKEYIIVKCIKHILNSENVDEKETDDISSLTSMAQKNKSHVIKTLIFSVISPRLATRILVTEVLVFLSYYSNNEFLPKILESMVLLQDLLGDYIRFQPWLNSLELFLDQYFTSGSDRIGGETNLTNYSLTTLLLINSIIEGTTSIKTRISLRREFNDSRLLKVFDKLRVVNNERINEEIEKYEEFAEEDYSEFFNLGTSLRSLHNGDVPSLDDIYKDIKSQYLETDITEEDSNETIIKSIFQKFLMLKDSGRSDSETNKLLVLIDSVMQHVIAESTMIASDSNSVLNSSIQRLMDRLVTDDTARRAILESRELTKSLARLEEEKSQLEIEASFGFNDTLANLKKEGELSAIKIASQEKHIVLLQAQIKQMEEEKNKVAKLVDITRLGTLKNSRALRMAKGNLKSSEIVHELESVFSARSRSSSKLEENDVMVVSDGPSIIEVDGSLSPSNEFCFETQTPTKSSTSIALLPTVVADPSQESGETSSQRSGTSQLSSVNDMPSRLASSGPPPPPPNFMNSSGKKAIPPPPPLPAMLSTGGPATPAPPPPPLPRMLSNVGPAPPPPPPPPLPRMLSNGGPAPPALAPPPLPPKDGNSPTGPPPPPPLPALFSESNSVVGTPKNLSRVNSNIPSVSGTPTPLDSDADLEAPISLIQSVRPKAKLKQMHWEKIDDINQTFWTDIEHGKLSDKLLEKGILGEVEKVFVAKSSTIKLKKDVGEAKEISQKKISKISFLSRDLAQLFGINLHMYATLSVEEFVSRVLQCNREILENVSVLEFFNNDSLVEMNDLMIRNFTPYSTDLKRPDVPPKKNPEELERPDRIYLELCFNLSHYWKSRSRALLLIQSYQKDYLDLLKKLQLIDEATSNVRKSESLRNVLGIIRSVGNFMNDFSKQAMGFKLDTLQRLKFMKDDTNSMNFLHYIEKIIRNTFPEFGAFVDELSSLTVIQNIPIDQLDSDCQEFGRMITIVSTSISKGNLSDTSMMHPQDRILNKVSGPLENAKIKNSLLQAHLKRTLDEFESLMEYFGENPKDSLARNGFLNKFVNFINEFKKAHVENIQREEDQRAYDARKRMVEDSKLQIAKNKETRMNKVEEDEEEDEVDEDEPESSPLESKTDISDTSHTMIDNLLERLKSSAPSSSLSKDRNRNRRSKALSFYSSMSLDDLVEQASTDGTRNSVGRNPLLEYESVNLLKRRMTTRKKQPESQHNYKTDQIMLRAQAMLSQLRNENNDSMELLAEISS